MNKPQITPLARRIREARDYLSQKLKRPISQAKLAEMCGWGQTRIANYERGIRTPSPDDVFKIAQMTGCRVEWLQFGSGEMLKFEELTRIASPLQPNIEPGPENRGSVPVISWIQAGAWAEAIDNFQPDDAEEWLPAPMSHGPRTYALRVRGDSMTAPYGKTYQDGWIIYVDPDQAAGVVTGDRVVAKLNGENAVTFKVFVDDNGLRYLKALNPTYLPITDEFRVLGKVIGSYVPE